MQTLPDNPSLDFLRQQAKDLRGALLESSQDVSLSDAQNELARQYGFHNWPELKAEVEQRRAAVPTGDQQLAQQIADAFGFGDVIAVKPIAHETMGRRWQLVTDSGRWAVGPVFDWITPAQAETAASLLTAARAAGISAPASVRSPGGSLLERVQDQVWRADEWLETGPTVAPVVSRAVAQKVGEILGTLHGLALPTDLQVNPYLTHRRPLEEWAALLDQGTGAGAEWAPVLTRVLPEIKELMAVEHQPPGSPLILCHSNLIPENVRLGRGDDLVVLHWDFTGPLTPTWEIASALRHWGQGARRGVSTNAVRALREGYGAAAPELAPEDFAVAVSGWLNYLHAQLCESVNGTDPEQRRLATALGADMLAHPLTTAGIDEVLAAWRS